MSVSGGEPLNIGAYAARYSSRSKITRLLFMAKHGESGTKLQALKMAYNEIRKGQDVQLYRDVVKRIKGKLENSDLDWIEVADRRKKQKISSLEEKLKKFKVSKNTESLVKAYNQLAELYFATSDLKMARACYSLILGLKTSRGNMLQACMQGVLVSIEMARPDLVNDCVEKAGKFVDDSDHVAASKLLCASGLANLEHKHYKSAALKFLAVDLPLGTSYELIAPQDIAIYGALCSLATFNQVELEEKVVSNVKFQKLLDLLLDVKELVNNYSLRLFGQCMAYLEILRPTLLLDIHLRHHVKTLYARIRRKALIPYAPALTLPFVEVDFESMAQVFNTTIPDLVRELQELSIDNPRQDLKSPVTMKVVDGNGDAVYDDSNQNEASFGDFVQALLNPEAIVPIKRLCLKLRSTDFDQDQYTLVNECLLYVLLDPVVSDIELDINVREEDYTLPEELFTCSTLVKLKIGSGFVVPSIPVNALLPALRTLIVDSVTFTDQAFEKLIPACPVIEEVIIDARYYSGYWKLSSCTVLSKILKKLTIRCEGWGADDDGCNFNPISFDTPRLEYLEYSDVLRDDYLVVNFSSLVHAKLKIPFRGNCDPTILIKGIRNVLNLSLGAVDTMRLFSLVPEAVPVFENLVALSVTTDAESCWTPLLILLEKSPKLKTLTIEGTLHYLPSKNICPCLLGYSSLKGCHIEALHITRFRGDRGELLQLKYILQKLSSLKLLEVDLRSNRLEKNLKTMEDLLNIPRVSSELRFEAKFDD